VNWYQFLEQQFKIVMCDTARKQITTIEHQSATVYDKTIKIERYKYRQIFQLYVNINKY